MTLLAGDSKQSPAPKLSWRVWEVSPGSWCWPHQSLWPRGHWGGLFSIWLHCSCSITWSLASELELLPTCMGRAFGKKLSM